MITPEQLKERRNFIGSSDIAAILGADNYRTAADVYWSKVQEMPDIAGNDAIALGNAFEGPLLAMAAERLGVQIETDVRRVHSGGILAANLDALVIGERVALEAKTSGLTNPMWDGSDWGAEGSDEVPDRVILQAQHQMLCADLDLVHVPALLGRGRGFSMFRIERNQELAGMILDAASRFWNDHVLAGVPPEGIPSLETIKRIPRKKEAEAVPVDVELFRSYLIAKDAAKAAADEKDALEKMLLASLGDAEAGECSLGTIRYPQQSRTAFDQKSFKAAHPDLAAAYASASSYRRIYVKEAK